MLRRSCEAAAARGTAGIGGFGRRHLDIQRRLQGLRWTSRAIGMSGEVVAGAGAADGVAEPCGGGEKRPESAWGGDGRRRRSFTVAFALPPQCVLVLGVE